MHILRGYSMWEPPDMRLMNWKDILLINRRKGFKVKRKRFSELPQNI